MTFDESLQLLMQTHRVSWARSHQISHRDMDKCAERSGGVVEVPGVVAESVDC